MTLQDYIFIVFVGLFLVIVIWALRGDKGKR
jgi:hypothetical protein